MASKTLTTAKPLGVLSRAAVNRNVKLENIDALPLPLSVKDECFENVASDRSSSSESIPTRTSLKPCECCFFRAKEKRNLEIPEWYVSTFESPLRELATDAEWCELPERESLLKEYSFTKSKNRRKDLESCLNTLRFDSATGLGKAHEWIRRYVYHRLHHGWFHLSIRARELKMFVDATKTFDLVVLPYGCASFYKLQMIVVVKDGSKKSFLDAIADIGFVKRGRWLDSTFEVIEGVSTLIKKIALVGQPRYPEEEDSNVFFEPVVPHAIWWMFLLVSHGKLDKFARRTMCEKRIGKTTAETTSEGKRVCASAELGIENCVLRFYPLHQCIGDPISDLTKHIYQNRPFVYWFGGKVLSVTDVSSPRADFSSESRFVRWCVARQMNTLLNLNGDSWVEFQRCRVGRYWYLEDYTYNLFE